MIKTKPTFIPAIPVPGNSQPETNRTLGAIKEALEVGLGRRGDPLDAYVTKRDLVNSGIARTGNGLSGPLVPRPGVGGPQVVVDVPGTINGLPDNTPPNYGTNDFTPPPVVTGLQVVSMTTTGLMISWDAPNYGNHSYTEIFLVNGSAFGSSTNTEANFISLSGAAFKTSSACTGTSGTNPNKFFRAKPAGSSVVVALSANDIGGSTSLASLLNPPTFYCFARFVSLAAVPGPFGPPGSVGAAGQPSIDPLAVLDMLTKGVQASNVYTDLTQFIGTDPIVLAQVAANGGVNGIYTNVVNQKDTLDKLYTVQLGTTLPDGNIIAAGFGLGITTNVKTGTASSLFAVNADQFAIMGGGGTYSPIASFLSSSSTVGTFTIKNGNLFADISSAFNSWNQAIPIGNPPIVVIKSSAGLVKGVQTDVFNGVEATITGITGNKITCSINTPSGQAVANTWPFFSANVPKYICLATNIPFIVDTATQTVGIRGRLVVDGLIRATAGDFNTLTANNAFINSLRANIINANIVCGQSIIAGSGIDPSVIINGTVTDAALATQDAWIVKLSKPLPGGFPFQIYNPKRAAAGTAGSTLLSLFGGLVGPVINGIDTTQYPYMLLQGDVRIGGGATFNLRQGGAVAMGNTSNDGTAYTFWSGADIDYGTTSTQMENNGFFWIRAATTAEQSVDPLHRTARAGFNTSVFLGGDPLTIPSGTGLMTIVPPRAGGNATVFVSGICSTVHVQQSAASGSARTTIGAKLWLMPASYNGPGAGVVRSGVGTIGSPSDNVGFFGRVDPGPDLTSQGGYAVVDSQYDFLGTDINNIALQGSTSVPAGNYKVFMELWLKPSDSAGDIGCFSGNFFAMQVQR